MEYSNISKEDFVTLQNINEALGEIYTKGQDSVIIVKVRTALLSVLNNIYETGFVKESDEPVDAGPINVNLVTQEENDIKEE